MKKHKWLGWCSLGGDEAINHLGQLMPLSQRSSPRFLFEFLTLVSVTPLIYTAWEIKWIYGKLKGKKDDGFLSPILKDWQTWLLYPVIMVLLLACVMGVWGVVAFYGAVILKNKLRFNMKLW